MNEHKVGIIMNGVTGRMGTNQHLLQSIVEIIKQGGVRINDHETIMPDPILVGRNKGKLKSLCKISGIQKHTLYLDKALADPQYTVYFDAQTTSRRADAIKDAITARKHIYCETPLTSETETALELYHKASEARLKHGVVQDKLWLPGIIKLRRLIETGFFGDILSIRGEFGYWVFEGDTIPSQHPSWNYRKEDAGGIIHATLSHWRYMLDNLFGQVKSVSCIGATHIKDRINEHGNKYKSTAEDAAYTTFELDNNVIAQFNASWCTRVRKDDLLNIQVDGTKGSAVVGTRDCFIQPYAATPNVLWVPDINNQNNYFTDWQKLPEQETYDNPFKIQWELFLKHVVLGNPFRWNLLDGAKGVQLAEKGMESWVKKQWVSLPDLS
ncbi:MAG: Gfo/Idh/MocA family protein [Bacteroidota bacterium]